MTSFLSSLTPQERLFLLEMSPSKMRDNSIFCPDQSIDAQIAEKELQLEKLRASSNRKVAVSSTQTTTAAKRESSAQASGYSNSNRTARPSSAPRAQKPLLQPTQKKATEGYQSEKLLSQKANAELQKLRDEGLTMMDLHMRKLLDDEPSEIRSRLALATRPFADIESHLTRLSRLNACVDDTAVEQSEVPKEFVLPQREVGPSDVESLKIALLRSHEEATQYRDEVLRLRAELRTRAAADAERHAQRDRVVSLQGRQLFGSMRRIEWLLQERKQLVKKCEERKAYIVKLERRLLEVLGYPKIPSTKASGSSSVRPAAAAKATEKENTANSGASSRRSSTVSASVPKEETQPRPRVVMGQLFPETEAPAPQPPSPIRKEVDHKIAEIEEFTARLQETLQMSNIEDESAASTEN
jgi:hypothetical protein